MPARLPAGDGAAGGLPTRFSRRDTMSAPSLPDSIVALRARFAEAGHHLVALREGAAIIAGVGVVSVSLVGIFGWLGRLAQGESPWWWCVLGMVAMIALGLTIPTLICTLIAAPIDLAYRRRV